jgi:hypothetical protein
MGCTWMGHTDLTDADLSDLHRVPACTRALRLFEFVRVGLHQPYGTLLKGTKTHKDTDNFLVT